MRLVFGMLALVALAAPALAQTGQTIAVPPAPVLTPAPSAPVAPTAPAAPAPTVFGQVPPPATANTDNGAPGQPAPTATAPSATPPAIAAPAVPVPPDAAAPVSNTWLPAGAAQLDVLNKVDGSTQKITIAPGGQATVGDLVVSVQSCLVRPADQLPDAAVFLSVQPAGNDTGAANFRGWMIRSAPGATVVGDAGETFRLIGCS
jgi:hypothetical protein